MEHVQQLTERYLKLREDNLYAYFELACTKSTDWCAWITDRPPIDGKVQPDRKVIAFGQGGTADSACKAALLNLAERSVVSPAQQVMPALLPSEDQHRAALRDLLVDVMTEQLGIDAQRITDEAKLTELDMDSLDAVELIIDLEGRLALDGSIDDFDWFTQTFKQATDEIMRQLKALNYDMTKLVKK